jgi:hypothetical protein
MQSQVRRTRGSAVAILAEVGGAIVGGLVIGAAFYFLAFFLFRGADLGMGLLAVQVFGIVLGFGVGAGLGAALAGRLVGQPGSWWMATLAGAATAVIVILILRLFNIGGLGGVLFAGVPLTLIAAVAGYQFGRR